MACGLILNYEEGGDSFRPRSENSIGLRHESPSGPSAKSRDLLSLFGGGDLVLVLVFEEPLPFEHVIAGQRQGVDLLAQLQLEDD